MNTIDRADRLFDDLRYQHPRWPSTFSPCACGRLMSRGNGRCVQCIKEELSGLTTPELAEKAIESFASVTAAWVEICKHIEEKSAGTHG